MLKFRTHGKWILAGEHSVLRGGKALVFPVQSRHLDFSFEPGDKLKVVIEHENKDLEGAFWGVLKKALRTLGLKETEVCGAFHLVSNIPVGAGMGASATLCVSLARWLTRLGYLPENEQYHFAKNLENIFHGESSGVDVAIALQNSPLEFTKPETMKPFTPSWSPTFYLSYCGKKGGTSECITRVQKLLEDQPLLGQKIDQDMEAAVAMAKEALQTEGQVSMLGEAIELASQCFQSWELVTTELKEHMSFLKGHGALATKPTGSGEGGFVLSLWNEPPSQPELMDILIKA